MPKYYEASYLPANFTVRDRQTNKKYVARPSDVTIAEARAELSLDRATLDEAQTYLAALKGEAVPDNATGSNLIILKDAQFSVQSAEDELTATKLIAPISGTVMSLDFQDDHPFLRPARFGWKGKSLISHQLIDKGLLVSGKFH